MIGQWGDRAAHTLDIDPEPDRATESTAEPNKRWLSHNFAGRWSLSADLQPGLVRALNGLHQRRFERLTPARCHGDLCLERFDAPMLFVRFDGDGGEVVVACRFAERCWPAVQSRLLL